MHMSKSVIDQGLDTQERILLAAEGRFEFYGYNKTTMAEIADDLSMSAANLYRYFRNKKSIAEECVKRCIDARISSLRSVVLRADISPSEKLEAFILKCLHVSYAQLQDKPRINEMVISISQGSFELVEYKINQERALLVEIIAEGNSSGEFSIIAMEDRAAAVHTSILLFDIPLFMGLYSLQEFEVMARQSTSLILHGLLAR